MAAPAVSTREQVRATKMRVLAFLCVCLGIAHGQVLSERDEKSCAVLYREGIDAYLDERWQDCIDNLENALTSYRAMKHSTVTCRLKCQSDVNNAPFISPVDIEDFHFYERMLMKTLCLLKCNKRDPRSGQNRIPKETEKAFEELKPYEYLQLCYFQKNMLQKAASAVFTFLVVNPENKVMLDNLKFYSDLPEVNMAEVTNFEARDYISLYIHGSEAYNQQDYKEVISYIEESLEDYLRGEEECRAFCEGPFDQGWFPDFVSSIANHFTFCLKCKRKCPGKMNSLNGEEHKDLLPSHYHFLQYAYYKVGNLKKACEAVASYLVFYPADETMLNNREYYLKLPKVQDDYFEPREEAVKYVERQEYEIQLLNFIETEFVFQDNKDNEVDSNESEKRSTSRSKGNIMLAALTNIKLLPPPIIKFQWPKYDTEFKSNAEGKKTKYMEKLKTPKEVDKKDQLLMEEELRRRKKRAVEQMQKAAARNIQVIMGEKELKGKYRFVAEGFANASECNKLLGLAQVAAVQGDGYQGNMSPHTNYEKFEGVTLGRAALLVYLGFIEVEILDLYLKLSEMGRDYLERYFNLKTELYFTYTHLVCRTALAGSPINRTDMSHSVHADNCNLLKSGECTRKPPAYTWRDFSAILYLNEDFEGGEFIFATDISAKKIESIVKPRCGRLVGFSAGNENLHGVRGVRKGRRCAVGLWFTFNPIYEEIERILAKQVLHQVQESGNVADQLIQELRKYVLLHESSNSISGGKKTESTTIKEHHRLQDKYIKKSINPRERLLDILHHKDPTKIHIERHKESSILDLHAP